MQEKVKKEILRKVKKLSLITPNYSQKQWKNYLGAGCYTYALNLFINEKIFIGDIIGHRCTNRVSDFELIHTLEEEMNFIGWDMQEVETDYLNSIDEKMIYLQREEHTDYYHFLRKDKQGWSHKSPNELPEQRDSAGYLIEDPDAMIELPYQGWCFLLTKKVV